MKHTLIFMGLVACLAIGSHARAIEYNILLDTAQEIPAPTLNGATPSGTATVDVNTITGEVTVSGSFAGLTSAARAAHIHGLAPAGSTAGVLLGLTADSATSGSLSGTGTLDAAALAGLLAGQTYINVHTPNNGPGEIRGQIVDSDIMVYNLTLSPDQEIPAPNLGNASPSGSATVVVDKSSGLVEISGSYTGMTSNVAAAHLHGLAGPGSNAGVIFGFSVTGGTEGTFSGSSTLDDANLSGLLAGLTYINVHTANNGPGEIRAQVVPEPSALVLLLGGMLPWLHRFRRR